MGFFNNIFKIKNDDNLSVEGLTPELYSIYVYNMFLKKKDNILLFTNSIYEANDLYNRISNYTDKILFFPMDDFLTSEAIAISPEFMIERINTLNKLCFNEKYIVVSNLMGVLRYLPTKELWSNSIFNLKINEEISRDSIISKLVSLGYERVSLVTESGTFAVRGYVIDFFPLGEDDPLRIEFWGDTIDKIKYFDPDTQMTKNEIDNISVCPFSEFLTDNDSSEIVKKQKYLKFYNKEVYSLYDYLDNGICIYYDYEQILSAYRLIKENILEYEDVDNYNIKTNYMHDLEEINFSKEVYLLKTDNYSSKKINNVEKYISYNIDNYKGNNEKLMDDINNYLMLGKTIIICTENKNLYKYFNIDNYILTDEFNIIEHKINIINKKIISGFSFNYYVVISDNDFKETSTIKYKSNVRYKIGTKITSIDNISHGDYIVHEMFGIGIYDKLCTLTKNGLKKDYIRIIYAGNDSLYIPVENIDRISKYSSKEGSIIKLDKIGSDSWIKRKSKIRQKLEDIAEDLLKVSVERESQEGYAFSHDDEYQVMFDNGFIYSETPDQIKAINSIKKEMEKTRPMDMLLCGDVGYGKTEVAFRAIFKAVNDGKQVAYLCPTTILSNQQYKNAIERFSNFSVRIGLLNRFVSQKDQKRIIEEIKEGKIDIIFGTHRILSDDISFKDLGLLVVDEEQRFGVTHKEKIKKYKSTVDILTLSATPIPRTLQMSMTGIRSLALIETPPKERFPVQTYVLPENNNVIKDAIYKELSRDGQIFILFNYVEKIEKKLKEIQKLVPEARIEYAHGRMTKIELENKMQDFIDHKFDALLCTTIIETGIDIPNVNTLIILDSDHFGLSQLYQIRGRIGRSNKIGYAYLMYNNKKMLNDIAIKRLDTIKEFTELGSGFKIALRDLSIRGAGDILGREQSGYIDSVGIDLYLKMLNDSIKKIKGEEVEIEEEKDSKPLIEVETHISDNYIEDEDLRINIHKKINEVDSLESMKKIEKELIDRFGKITEDIKIYMYEEWFEKLAKKLNIINVINNKNNIEIELPEEVSKEIDGEKLFYKSYDICKYFNFQYNNNKIKIILDKTKVENHFLIYLIKILELITNGDVKK